jgi:diguanylate cyclase (GGDEF)-like protein/PAS domain S-box-containing protein
VPPAHPDPAQPAGRGTDFFRVLLEGYTDVIVVLDDAGTIRYATPSAATLFGPAPIIGARLPDLVDAGDRPEVARAVSGLLGRGATEPGTEGIWQITGLAGQPVHVQVHSRDLRGTSAVAGLVLTLRDVTGQHQLEDELRRRATYDARTGLPNAELFADRAERAVTAARDAGTTAAVMLVDLDDFKAVNDTLGHLAGNELLAAAAARLAGAIRESDTAARWGGDEFAILLENLPGPAEAAAFAGRVAQAFSAPFALKAARLTISVSIGVATTADSTGTGELVAHADEALYAAKNAGKGTWRAYHTAAAGNTPGPGRPQHRPSSLDYPDPRPDMSGRRPRGRPAGPHNRPGEGPDRPRPRTTP